MSPSNVSISIQIPVEKHKELSDLSIKSGVLKSNLVRSWIYNALEEEKKKEAA